MPTTTSRESDPIVRDRDARRALRRAVDDLTDARGRAGLGRRVPAAWWAVLVLGALAALVVAVAGIVSWVSVTGAHSDADYKRAVATEMSLLLGPDSTDPGQVQRILDGATGTFHDEFAQSAQSYTEFVERTGTVAHATVTGTGVAARSGDAATVLVAATVIYRPSSAGQVSPSRDFRLRVLVTPEDGRLKVAAVQYLP
ncbi:hypothetical protein [Gordonia sp. NPDC003429]